MMIVNLTKKSKIAYGTSYNVERTTKSTTIYDVHSSFASDHAWSGMTQKMMSPMTATAVCAIGASSISLNGIDSYITKDPIKPIVELAANPSAIKCTHVNGMRTKRIVPRTAYPETTNVI
jgi:hypothetical protein